MKITALMLSLFFIGSVPPAKEYRWGQTGHRVVGHIADGMLTKKASKQVRRVLGHETLAEVSTWMDEIKSDRAFSYAGSWHYTTIPDGQTYATAEKQENGDVIWAIDKIVTELKSGNLTPEREITNLKFLVHLVGDIHQPFHVGNGDDRGGNDVKVQYFGSNTNIHSVWDSRMIDGKQYSYTELANRVNHATKDEIRTLQSATVEDWAIESMAYRSKMYDLPEDGKLSYRYGFDHFAYVEKRLMEAGIRLAGVINEIYK